MEVSYSLSFNDNLAPPPPALWAFCGVEMLPAPDHAVLLRRLDDDRRHFVRRDVAAALDHCRHFSTLEAHAVAVGDVIPELKGRPDAAMPVLKQMAELGFLRRAEELLDRMKAGDSAGPLPPPKVFIITCDRPAALRRLLGSLAENPENREFEITVIDDSRDPANLTANAEAASHAPGLRVAYFGMAERAGLMAGLIRRLPEHEASIRFLIDRERWPGLPTYGLARNLALLLSVGERLIILDDDILGQAIPSPEAQSTLAFGSVNDRRMAFWSDQQTMLNANPPRTESPLALVADALGKSLAQITAQTPAAPQSLAGARGDDWWALSGDARVIKTQCGTFGDPGTGEKAHWVVNLPPDDIEALLAAGPSMEDTLDARAIWMGYRRPTLMRFGSMAAVTGLDHREPLPPYLPVLRGEDFLFGVMLEKMARRGVVLGVPWSVPHLPLEQRARPSFDGAMAATLSAHTLALWLDTQISSSTGGNRAALSAMAAALDQVARADTLPSTLSSAMSSSHLRQLEQINRQVKFAEGKTSSRWQQTLAMCHKELVETLQSPIDIEKALASSNASATLDAVRQGGTAFAGSLLAWQALGEASQPTG